jgi:signal transduction histidine kinase
MQLPENLSTPTPETSLAPLPMLASMPSVSPFNFFGETRTRIFLLFLGAMLLATAIGIPIFRILLRTSIETRVQADLSEHMEEFRKEYGAWEQSSNQSEADLNAFIDEFLSEELPEDDNFFITYVDGELYRSSPQILLAPFREGSDLATRWANTKVNLQGIINVSDPSIDSIIYFARPILLEGESRGVFVAVHASAGEQAEAISAVWIFAKVASGVVLLALVGVWLATGKVMEPVRRLANTARIISDSDLTKRIPLLQGSSEMADLTQSFNAMMDRLQVAFDAQRNFVNDAGHELRTPITIIQGNLELMGDDPQDREETLSLVFDELERMSRLVNDLVTLAKAEHEDFLQLESLDVADFGNEVFTKIQTLSDRQWQFINKGKGKMTADRQRLTGAIINLAQNAIQYTEPDDFLELGIAIDNHDVRFWIRDTGEGINLDDQKRIFDRFARSAKNYRRSEGAGLGLAIVKAITEAHSGQVELVSQVGVGSTFTLVLPLQQG